MSKCIQGKQSEKNSFCRVCYGLQSGESYSASLPRFGQHKKVLPLTWEDTTCVTKTTDRFSYTSCLGVTTGQEVPYCWPCLFWWCQWRNWQGASCRSALWQAKYKNWASINWNFDIYYSLGFRLVAVFLRSLGCFRFILDSLDIHDIRVHYHFLTFFLCAGYQ